MSLTSNFDYDIQRLIQSEENYMRLINKYNKTQNPAVLSQINNLHKSLCTAWDSLARESKYKKYE